MSVHMAGLNKVKRSESALPRTVRIAHGMRGQHPDHAGSVALWQSLTVQEYAVLDNPSDPYLTQYLGVVRALLNRALERHSAQCAPYWSPKGRFRQMVYVAEINHTLDELVNDIRHGHSATKLARRLDAIRGLLVDLWI